jgi:hypothetical protein
LPADFPHRSRFDLIEKRIGMSLAQLQSKRNRSGGGK